MPVHDNISRHTVYHFYAKCKVHISENTFFPSILLKTTYKEMQVKIAINFANYIKMCYSQSCHCSSASPYMVEQGMMHISPSEELSILFVNSKLAQAWNADTVYMKQS